LGRGQASLEFIIIVGMVMFFVVTGSIVLYNYSSRANDEVARANIHKIGLDLADSIEKVYYIGENSWETIRINNPSNVKNISIIDNSELVISYDGRGGMSEAVFFIDVNVTGPASGVVTNHSGLALIRVVSYGNKVNVTEVTG
jgi:hypothetical protein